MGFVVRAGQLEWRLLLQKFLDQLVITPRIRRQLAVARRLIARNSADEN